MNGVMVEVSGLEEINNILRQILPKEAVNVVRAALPVVAKHFAEGVEEKAPEATGKIKASVKSRRKKGSRNMLEAAVSIESPGRRHWHFAEFGTASGSPEQPFVLPAFQERKGDIEEMYVKAVADKIVKRAARVAKSRGL